MVLAGQEPEAEHDKFGQEGLLRPSQIVQGVGKILLLQGLQDQMAIKADRQRSGVGHRPGQDLTAQAHQ
jgi:hypothetical protein